MTATQQSATNDPYGLLTTVIADKYAVEEVVGEGGFGIVYRAQHNIWRQPVALKCFTALANAPVSMRDQLLDQFVQEGKLLSSLSTRTAAIVQARDIGTLETKAGAWMPYMVLEWLEGHPLDRLIATEHALGKPPRSLTEVFGILDPVARALGLAHAQGIAHRDIKPANFFVCDTALRVGSPMKVLDFGIAKVMQTHAHTAMQQTVGQMSSFTPHYGAPEQFDRVYGATGPWTDVFGFALVMIELLRGGVPALEGESFVQLAFASQNPSRRPTPRTFGIDVPDAVEAVFQQALAVYVVDRHQNMSTFWLALEQALRQSGSTIAISTSMATVPVVDDAASSVRASSVRASPVQTSSGRTLGYGASVTTYNSVSTTSPTGASTNPGQPKRSRMLVVTGVTATATALAGAFLFTRPRDEPSEPIMAAALTVAQPSSTAPPDPTPVAAPLSSPCPERMVFIEGGKFFMGSEKDNPVLHSAMPSHQVQVKSYCLDMYEVTTAQYQACSNKGECKRAYKDALWPKGGSDDASWKKARETHSPLCNENAEDRGTHPINCVTWAQANDYCRTVGKRLPSEPEWEFAARGSDGRVFPWGDDAPDQRHANACGRECNAWRIQAGLAATNTLFQADDGFAGTAPVGSFPRGRTQAGLHDMVGNVFEWTADMFEPYPGAPKDVANMVPKNARVIRGGAFNSFQPEHADPSLRFPQDADAHPHAIGFRCAKDPA